MLSHVVLLNLIKILGVGACAEEDTFRGFTLPPPHVHTSHSSASTCHLATASPVVPLHRDAPQ